MTEKIQNPIQKLSIKEWAADDRPREKLLAKGATALSDAELIAILISSGNKKESAVELSRRILKESKNNLIELGRCTIAELLKFEGIGEAKAISIIAAMELGRRRKQAEILDKKKISSSKDVFDLFHPVLGDKKTEEFWALFLNQGNFILDFVNISLGGITATVVDVREIFRIALSKQSVGLILCHNHPSGNIQPSSHDKSITEKVKNAGEIMDIKLLDHIIISNNKYYSFADEGNL
ncbi:MAG: hypothetical protein A2275_09895 [Bacteroidetes bacterium RIFOXYA12_FULL_35_11]|nr:MAG: hypothetical protein A2X01_03680 [Bacteroidetes bacterium GWF2_35_48]OFY82312.1 MAG: hypothetical protein A2275_09895 [Bacteroidetes bacterium RIFOXYA12_FULL_35_11]OFY96282.1 MAG: hypothetical protein A2491_06820 [Bacteroidetes bacterium RIFOXYC12_FULL_35_7]OFY97483.1 MAG: hypothetical protein A2309_06870 [Bacteroidetes bacterium RIFOXYB2_FULL_35_7]HBX51027.1 hypothetical protein [Bacteroidales bacterium]